MNTLIFDIGKTNKKALVFDKDFRVIEEQQTVFDEIADLDGDPTDDIIKIEAWIHQILSEYKNLDISKINFATYGATVAHLGSNGKLLAPPFNYLKPVDSSIKSAFLNENGGESALCTATASPDLDGLLNSGFQLYWLKKTRPAFFNQIKTTLHLPQYFSYVLTKQLASEYTSIGCHTMLWDFNKKTYHHWLEKEKMQGLLPEILPINTRFPLAQEHSNGTPPAFTIHHSPFSIGIGIHDSSAALLPYLVRAKKPFLLLSTGTWSICLNPFNTEPLTAEEFANDCLFYMRPDGASVKASRLFLGKIHDEAVEKLTAKFHKKRQAIRDIRFNYEIYEQIQNSQAPNLEEGYHHLMYDLIKIQVEKIKLAAGSIAYEKILIDGGFAKNDLYLTMLRRALPNIKIEPSDMPQGTALGAAYILANDVF